MNSGNNRINLKFEELTKFMVKYKEKLRRIKSDIWKNNTTLDNKNVYDSLEKFIKDVEMTQNTEIKNKKIDSVYKWFKKSLKTRNTKVFGHNSVNSYMPLIPYKDKNEPKVDFGDLFRTTKKIFTNEKNSFLNKTPKIEFNFLAPAKKVPNFTPKILVALNKDKIIRRNFSIDKAYHSTENSINQKINEKHFEKIEEKKEGVQNDKNFVKKRKFKRKIVNKKPSTSNKIKRNLSTNKEDFPQYLDINNKEIKNVPSLNNINNNDQFKNPKERYNYLKQEYKTTNSTLDFRKTVSNFKYVEFNSLKELLEKKKRKVNVKSLHEAFINPVEIMQPTFYLPKGGSGLLSRPVYCD